MEEPGAGDSRFRTVRCQSQGVFGRKAEAEVKVWEAEEDKEHCKQEAKCKYINTNTYLLSIVFVQIGVIEVERAQDRKCIV